MLLYKKERMTKLEKTFSVGSNVGQHPLFKDGEAICINSLVWVFLIFLCIHVVHSILLDLKFAISLVSECTDNSAFSCGLFV